MTRITVITILKSASFDNGSSIKLFTFSDIVRNGEQAKSSHSQNQISKWLGQDDGIFFGKKRNEFEDCSVNFFSKNL